MTNNINQAINDLVLLDNVNPREIRRIRERQRIDRRNAEMQGIVQSLVRYGHATTENREIAGILEERHFVVKEEFGTYKILLEEPGESQ